MTQLTYIDLFAGAGGLSEGFINEGFLPIAHVEKDIAACYTLKTRAAYHHLRETDNLKLYYLYLRGELNRDELYDHIPSKILDTVINMPIGSHFNPIIHQLIQDQLGSRKVDLIIGGPPCQAYSIVGRARSANQMAGDPRNYLYIQYGKYLKQYSPKVFVFENVIGLKSAKNGLYLKNMEKLFNKIGYKMKLYELDAKNFGVLQSRKRIVIIGVRRSKKIAFPSLEDINITQDAVVDDILRDLPPLQAGQGNQKFQNYSSKPTSYLTKTSIRNGTNIVTQHISRPNTKQDKEIYQIVVSKWNESQVRINYNDLPNRLKSHNNRSSFFDRFKVVAKNLPHSHTVVAHIGKDGHYYIHPDLNQNRSITIREAARLQSFPDNYYFEGATNNGGLLPAFQQIGNAVPPIMALEIAKRVKVILNG